MERTGALKNSDPDFDQPPMNGNDDLMISKKNGLLNTTGVEIITQKDNDNDNVNVVLSPTQKRQLDYEKNQHFQDTIHMEEPSSLHHNTTRSSLKKLHSTAWSRQVKCLVIKNTLLIARKKVLLALMLFSSVVSVILAWLATDPNVAERFELTKGNITACGTVSLTYLQTFDTSDDDDWNRKNLVPASYNEDWRSGIVVTILGIGPMFFALCVFIHIAFEFHSKLRGVLRGIGVSEAAYWTSWWIPFIPLSLLNALFGATTCVIFQYSVHVFRHTYFMGIFGSFLFLNISLTGASMLLAAICSTVRRAVPWIIIVMFVAAWAPAITLSSMGSFSQISAQDTSYASYESYKSVSNGMLWVNKNTTRLDSYWSGYEYVQNTTCEVPLLSNYQGTNFRPDNERYIPIPTDEYFLGCYFDAGFSSMIYQQPESVKGLWSTWFFPQTHFAAVWSNFLGYTSAHDRSFGFAEATKSPEQLAIDSLHIAPTEETAKGTSLSPQGSTFFRQYLRDPEPRSIYIEDEWGGYYTTTYWGNCPQSNTSDHFCHYMPPFSCNSIVPPSPTDGSPSTNIIFGYMFLLSLFYTLVASYWAQVLPGGNGAPLRPWFFFLPSYWFNILGKPSNEAARDDGEDISDRIIVQNVRKKFGKFEAVKGVSLEMLAGEVTALLGHNGAGKSTLSNMAACELTPTDGDIFVFGHSISKNKTNVRNLVSYCKQDDFLYPTLSAKEHLNLYAALGGRVPIEDIPQKVQHWLKSVDLAIVQDQYSNSFSGGMKRRLSVACCTIVEKPLVILDEPTTGMDPTSRRFVWKHIDEIKDGRVIVLTTHAMEEADLLADMVAIMRKGDLAAFGTPLELKSEHGSALQFSILVHRDDVASTKSFIKDQFESSEQQFVKIDGGNAGNLTVNIEKISINAGIDQGVNPRTLSDFVTWLESTESKVIEYGFSNSSLEEVFLRLTEGDVEEENCQDDNSEQYDVCCTGCSTSCIQCCLAGPCKCCCCPTRMLSDEDYLAGIEEQAIGRIDDGEIASFKPILSTRRQIISLLRFAFIRNWSGGRSIGGWIFHALLLAVLCLFGVFGALDVPYGDTVAAFMVIPTLLWSLCLVNFSSQIYGDRTMNQFYLMKAQGMLKRPFIFVMAFYPFIVMLIFGILAAISWYITPMFRDTVVCPVRDECVGSSYSCERTCYDWDWMPGDAPKGGKQRISFWEDSFDGTPVELYAVNNAGTFSQLFIAVLCFSLTMPGAVMTSVGIPGHKFATVLLSLSVIVASVAGAILYIVYAIDQLYSEEESNLCLWSFCNTTIANFKNDTIGDLGPEFLNCIKAEIGGLTHYCIPPVASILPQIGFFQLLAMTFTSHIKLVSHPPNYVEEKLIPTLGDAVTCNGDVCHIPVTGLIYTQNLGFMILGAVLLALIGYLMVSVVLFPEGPILSIKGRFARTWFLLKYMCGRSKIPSAEQMLDQDAATMERLEEVVREEQEVDTIITPFLKNNTHVVSGITGQEELKQSLASIDHSILPRDDLPPILTHKLRKVYPGVGGLPAKVALASLDLHVPKGQVLGLLGKNGAGKSTALKILALAHEATTGIGLVAGYDVSSEQLQVFERLGTCPQFDIVWQRLSVRNHLEFFASLKGLPMNIVKQIAFSLAQAVGLGAPSVYNRHAGALSGGMRRRLSIAISLIGAPHALLLDEPSTGLDPSTRNSIWDLVNSFATPERAIIITTHNMEEADTLSTRIAIVARGHLKMIGTQQHLKDKFGSGYRLQLNLTKSTKENQEKAMQFVRLNLHEEAELQAKQAKTLHVSLPKNLDLRRVFNSLYSNKALSEGCINQFLLSQSSLEDVFLSLGD